MKRFKVHYEGFAYVEAEDEEEARTVYEEGGAIYIEDEVTQIAEVDEFTVEV